ncbi:nuclear transport factor 2 family protein [Acerihabitans sp. TG2]|uniref:nuclear transport factor 2 family protein n=1 Tax=Acerihabitans sp. TG2 TaxID=3096008 RepID=UPI002B234538|nr:nuclear transport factor 2 family protein [Acerihabitans sp. TG2]MEA9393638.1 nuclear transport factor 2 family protein [Acerihabitans sp. TG2]
MKMPSAVQAFFEAKDLDVVANIFTLNAVVKDEGKRYNGRHAIRQWRVAATQKYQYISEPFEVALRGDTVMVRANVTGDFPGSPVVLGYIFHLAEENIDGLEISHD